jgi:hypothetical protein
VRAALKRILSKLRYHDGRETTDSISQSVGEDAKQVTIRGRCREQKVACRVVGWTSVVLAVAAIGLYLGHELRSRYKFRHQTQYDLFSHAGDSISAAEYGVGI